MIFIEILLLAIGLAMDAFAVSICNGLCMKKVQLKNAVKIGASTGGFQVLFPILGWLAGISFSNIITGIDHWIAFILLSFIGGKMIYEGTKNSKKTIDCEEKPLKIRYLLMLGVATSIDALAVGVTFAFLNTDIIFPVTVIGIITFSISVAGVYLGNKFGNKFEDKAEILGGIILIGIGLKILIEDLFFTN